MSQRHYEHAMRNARRWPISLLGASPTGAVLRRAARQARMWRRATDGWTQLADPEWASLATPESIDGDVLVVGVAHATLRAHLERRAEALARQLARIVPAIRRVRFIPAG